MVSTALFTGLSGLRVHQTYIDVIGNNLANVSTPGFRGSRATFSDLLSFTVRSGSGPSGNFGGINPLQIGHGAIMATVDTDLNQGTFQDTGRWPDVALQGRGFFTLSDGVQTFYSRVGSFTIDADRTLVDARSGMRVVNSTGNSIKVPFSDTLPAQASTSITFQGNLPAEVGGPLAEIVASEDTFLAGTAATKSTTASAGPGNNQFDLSGIANPVLLVSLNGQAQVSVSLPTGFVSPSTIAARFTAAGLDPNLLVTANDVSGTLQFDTVRLGDNASLKFDNGTGSAGLLTALGLDAALAHGTQTTATPGTSLNSLTSRTAPYVSGVDGITISGTNPAGGLFSDTFVYGTDGTTLNDLVNFINTTVNAGQTTPVATAELTQDGNIRLISTTTGEATMSLRISDAQGSTGGNVWSDFQVAQEGTGPDTAVTSIDVVDSQGRTHPVTLTFTRSETDTTSWDLAADIDPAEGVINQGSIGQIRFNNNGSFSVIGGGANSLQFTWNGINQAQTVGVDLGSSGQFDGIAMLGNAATVAAVDQDGYTSGTLLSPGFNTQGELVGYYTNGQSQVLDTLRVTMFSNEGGLLKVGDTMFVESPNSGDAISTTAGAAGAGTIRAGQLENSNVDIAREFVNLIEAQRGFQANSRVITTTDEILAELMNIVR
ncbi:MAG: flagellar hook-basal body complex protein [Planctomycetes bacterium]|nr:flagellar hook-basal body complex protein [Planctomycetota bacterium]